MRVEPDRRSAEITRKTGETDVAVSVTLDGNGRAEVDTGVPFLDHMLDALARHGRLAISARCAGDAAMDPHHTVEDTGIAFGQALRTALDDRRGIERYGFAYAPLDEALARTVIDCSGRPYLYYAAEMPEPVIGADFASSLVEEFWRAVAMNGGLTMHIDLLRARNAHHAAEAIFKSAALALRGAVRRTGDPTTIPSTKGILA